LQIGFESAGDEVAAPALGRATIPVAVANETTVANAANLSMDTSLTEQQNCPPHPPPSQLSNLHQRST
jgi:hypothetical protein